MGMIDRFLGISQGVTALGGAATGMAEVFTANATRKMELNEEAHARAMAQLGQEFASAGPGVFNNFVNGLNRLPRPFLALGTMGLFIYAMIEPVGFSLRMQGLQQVPEPLWWLLGAIVGFYFGAREAYHFRNRAVPPPVSAAAAREAPAAAPVAAPAPAAADDYADNAALYDWFAALRR